MNRFYRSSLFQRYTFLLITVFTLTGLLYLFTSFGLSQYYLTKVQTNAHKQVAQTLIKDHQLVKQGQLNQEAISKTFHRYMLLNPHLQIYLLDAEGKILKYSADVKKIKRLKVGLEPIHTFLNHPEEKNLVGDDPRDKSAQKPFSAAALPSENRTSPAYLYVIIQDSIDAEANRLLHESIMLKLGLYSFLFSLVIGLALGLILFKRLIRRIEYLSEGVSTFKQNYSPIIAKPDNTHDELDQLQSDISTLSEQIQKQLQQLEQTAEQRQFVLSSLSHDLRTPLTNLLGYIEQISKTSENDQYLNTAYQNGLTLKHYLDQLFDFAKLDMKDFEITHEELSLSEFCYDVIEHHHPHPTTKKIHINISQNFVCLFDPRYLERALTNLLDNAHKYGQTTITVDLNKRDDGVIIRVCSDGESIEQLMNHTPQFEPFFIKNARGSGLGLSIVNAIAEKHDGKLTYERKNEMNCFSIALPYMPPSN